LIVGGSGLVQHPPKRTAAIVISICFIYAN
jgi:hypothetical protein